MQELVEFLIESLVDSPDEVTVSETQTERSTVLKVHVADADMGKIIGRQGRIINAIRSVVSAAAQKRRCRATVEIVEPQSN